MTGKQQQPPSKMVLKLNEENDVKFKLSINGTVANPSQTEVVTRFVVTENASGISWMFPLEPGMEDGLFVASIPEMPSVFSENLDYTGKVEVIVGNRYYNPTNVTISFENELKIEATPLLTEKTDTQQQEEDHQAVNDILLEGEPPPPPLQKKKPELPFNESVIQKVMFSASPSKHYSPQQQQPTTTRRRARDPGREKYKNKLKSLIAQAWKEIS